MKSRIITRSILKLTASLTLTFGLADIGWAAPSIQSVVVSPNPLTTGENFTITVTASPEVDQASATVSFRPGQPKALEIPLMKQGAVWTGAGLVPSDLTRELPAKAGALVKVVALDAAHHRAERVVQLTLNISTISAVFSNGVLTVTGDDRDNTLVVSRDAAGNILVNDGALLITGGLPTVANTTLIRILGLGGNDTLTVDAASGPMPPANLLGGDGDDTLTGSASNDLLDGGPGNDILRGGVGNDTLVGGPGNDILIGGQGADQVIGGEGDDQIIWNPGDGSDVVEGENGDDTLIFNGSNASEMVDLSANGQRLRFFRNVGNVTMDCDGIEQVIFRASGSADTVTVNDLTGTQVADVVVDLFATPGAGDGQADTVIVNGTETNDVISVSGSTNGVEVAGLAATVTIVGAEPNLDQLLINGLDGDDLVDASQLAAGLIGLTLNGGTGDDQLIGSPGNDVLVGGRGNDVAFGGAGDDTFVWNPGDGSDVIEGQEGQDTLLFNGANVGETVDLSANGQRLRFFRDVASITMDCDGVESVRFNALGGSDTITVNDLAGTSVTNVSLDLASPPASGTGDSQPDTVIVNGTSGNDTITVGGNSAEIMVQGLAATVRISASEAAFDRLIINALDGDDAVEAADLAAGAIALTEDGGAGNDVLVGSPGADVLLGGDGDDILLGGPGLDALDGGPGANVLIQD